MTSCFPGQCLPPPIGCLHLGPRNRGASFHVCSLQRYSFRNQCARDALHRHDAQALILLAKAGESRMLNRSNDVDAGDRPDIGRLLERLARESRDWAEAEMTLARLELTELKLQALRAAGFAAIGFAFALCALLALTEAAIDALSRLVATPSAAALMVAVILALAAIACGLGARRTVAWRSESLFLRWLGLRASDGGRR